MGSSKKNQPSTIGSWVLVAAAILFFFGSLILYNPAQMYVSPDETANAYFSELFASTGVLGFDQGPLVASWSQIRPRSIVNDVGVLKPGSFLGLPVLYGALVSLFGDWVLWVITPLIVIAAAFVWRVLIRRIASEHVATLSSVLFLLHPAMWYYSARGLMHNALFVSLLVFAAWFGIERPLKKGKKPAWANDVLAGLCVGLALFVRTSEIMWVVGALLLLALWQLSKLNVERLALFALGGVIGLSVILGFNFMTYGDMFTTGYTLGTEIFFDPSGGTSVDAVKLLPFGFHPKSALMHLQSYGIMMFWWLSTLGAIGFFTFLAYKRARPQQIYLSVFVLISAWLVLMYGSWEIFDNPDPTQITIANSYTRYWLPMYLMSTPLIASAVSWISERGRTKLAKGLFTSAIMVAIIGLNLHLTFFAGQDGLVHVRETLLESNEIQASVLEHTAQDAIIIVDRADKLFFPHRNVWYPLRDEATYDAIPLLLQEVSLYYYGITFPQEDFDYLNDSKLGQIGLVIEQIETYGEESLYRIFEP